MAKLNYTKGNWKVTHTQLIQGKEFKWVVVENNQPPNKCIADVFSESNAQLISASPDMYGALKFLWDNGLVKNDQVKNALAKAEGKQ